MPSLFVGERMPVRQDVHMLIPARVARLSDMVGGCVPQAAVATPSRLAPRLFL